jgi:hypothetical protein
VTWPDRWGLHVSEGEGETRIPVRVGFLGRGPKPVLGQMVSRGPFRIIIFPFLFFFFFSVFLFLL